MRFAVANRSVATPRPGHALEDCMAGGDSAATLTASGHNPPFTCIADRTFRRRQCPVTGRPIVNDERSFTAFCRH